MNNQIYSLNIILNVFLTTLVVMNLIKKNISLLIIGIFHLVGIIGFLTLPDTFKSLSPVNLLLSICLVLLAAEKNKKLYIILMSIALIGFLIEVIGVKTGIIFGNYQYGEAFGFSLFAVPILIGFNWAILLYGTSQFCKFKNRIVNVLFSSFLMTFIDFFIEHIASRYDFWYWENNQIPIQNYAAWFLISVGLNLLFQKTLINSVNYTAKGFYIIQLLFFVILNTV